MKKSVLIFGFVLLGVICFTSCVGGTVKEKPAENKEAVAKVQYTCPMHPEVISDKPGDCPKCGMPLVEKK
ncbi:MAG: heavy metal-binding domain-containing protein [Bacteroidales bacterium]